MRPVAAPTGTPGGSTLPLYLALFLLLAAFFLILNSRAPREGTRAEATIASVARAFGPGARPRQVVPPEPPAIDWAEATGRSLAELLPLASLAGAGHAHGARFALAADTLFLAGEAALRPERVPVIERLAQRLRQAPAGRQAGIEIRFGQRGTGGELSARRAALLFRALLARGAPAAGLAIGLAPGDAQSIELVLATHSVALAALRP
jgi:hypothetical protein